MPRYLYIVTITFDVWDYWVVLEWENKPSYPAAAGQSTAGQPAAAYVGSKRLSLLCMHTHTHTLTHTLTEILHNAFAIFLKCILPPFYAFQQMSVFLGKEHTPSPGSLKKIVCHKFNRNFIDSVTQTSFPMMSRIKQQRLHRGVQRVSLVPVLSQPK